MRFPRTPCSRRAFLGSLLVVVLLSFAPAVRSQDGAPDGEHPLAPAVGCEPDWIPTFGSISGVDGHGGASVWSFGVFDDGNGEVLYTGGDFDTAAGVWAFCFARWNGQHWSSAGGSFGGSPLAMQVFDDGSGPALYVGGGFLMAGGQLVNNIARWDGQAWSPLGAGVSGPGEAQVSALAVFDDGNGEALYAGGRFTTAGGHVVNHVAKWDGQTWSALGEVPGVGGLNAAQVSALAVYDDGTGPALYVGGNFTKAGKREAFHVAKWNGATWSKLGQGLSGGSFPMQGMVRALAAYDDGSGEALYAGGNFTTAGGVEASRIARWDGQAWSALGAGVNSIVRTLTTFDDGSGEALYAGGYFSSAGGVSAPRVAKWDGAGWSGLGSGLGGGDSWVVALAVYDAGEGPRLYAGGQFTAVDGVVLNHVARWNGTGWEPPSPGLSHTVRALEVFSDGEERALYAGGLFLSVGDVALGRVGRWDGEHWSPLGDGLPNGWVDVLKAYDDGSGPALYAGGTFMAAGSAGDAHFIARWDGLEWSALGQGIDDVDLSIRVNALTVFDDGRGPALYVGGTFYNVSGVPMRHVARWDGASWSPLGNGTEGGVYALAVFDDGTGPALYAGGWFTTASGVLVNNVAKWDGQSWSALGAGVSGGSASVQALAVYDDGSGEALYVGGRFTIAGDVAVSNVAKWNGTEWSALGAGVSGGSYPSVTTLAAWDDGSGSALYAGGGFAAAGDVAVKGLARWDGASWSTLKGGAGGGTIHALASFDAGNGPALFVGGHFPSSPAGDSHLAQWGGCPLPPAAWTVLGAALPGGFGAPRLIGRGSLAADGTNSLALTHAAPSALAALFLSGASTPLPFKGGTLVPVPPFETLLLATDPSGGANVFFTMPPGIPPGTEFFAQWAVQDAAAAQGVSLSNALVGVTP